MGHTLTFQGWDVAMVCVDERMVVEGGRPVCTDLDEVVREAQRAAEVLWARAAA
jgi:hypothetical protein